MKKIFLISLFSLILFSCQEINYVADPQPKVELIQEAYQEGTNLVTVNFIPSSNTDFVEFYKGTSEDITDFESGKITELYRIDGNTSFSYEFDKPVGDVVLYARAVSEERGISSISTLVLIAEVLELKVNTNYLLPESLGIEIPYNANYKSYRVFLGQANQKDAFLEGAVSFLTQDKIMAGYKYIFNFFDLEPETEYVFYAIATDITNHQSKLVEFPIVTPSTSEAPYITIEINKQDAFYSEYLAVPNDKTTKLIGITSGRGTLDEVLFSELGYYGDIGLYLANNATFSSSVYTSNSGALTLPSVDFSFNLELKQDVYVALYDNEGEYAGVQYFPMQKQGFNTAASYAEVTVEVSDITATSANYTYTPDENTMCFFVETIDAEWYDSFKETSQWHDRYIHEYFLAMQDYPMVYAPALEGKPFVFEAQGLESGKRYYACTCAMNVNGLEGWSELVLEEFIAK